MAPHSSTLAWKIPWMEEPGGLQSMGSLRVDTTERLHFHFSLSCIEEGNGNPLQCFCLENPRDGGAWWAAVYGVTQSWTRLKWLSSSSSSSSTEAQNLRRGSLKKVRRTISFCLHHPFLKAAEHSAKGDLSLWYFPRGMWGFSELLASPAVWDMAQEVLFCLDSSHITERMGILK